MIDDIVTRLREKYAGQLPICLEAADEIERLQEACDYYHKMCSMIADKNFTANEEIERLRTIIRDYYLTEKEYESCREQNDIVYLEDEWKAAWKALEVEALRRDTW